MSIYTDLIARACSIEEAAFLTLAPPKTIKAFPYYFATSEKLPYTTHRITGMPIDHSDDNQDEQFPQPRLVVRVVVGHLTDKYVGENDNLIYNYIDLLLPYMAQRRWFQSAAYPAPLDELIYSEVVDAGGFMVFDNRGFAGVSQVGFELTIACTFTESIIQAYQE